MIDLVSRQLPIRPLSIIPTLFLTSCSPSSASIEKPDIFVFSETKETVLEKLEPFCESIEDRDIEPIELPTAQQSQTQLDCERFLYAGKERKIELVFADDILDMIWILTEADEEKDFIEQFSRLYGEPTHRRDDVTFFLNHGVAVRNQPHEVMFISDRLKTPYAAWLDQPRAP